MSRPNRVTGVVLVAVGLAVLGCTEQSPDPGRVSATAESSTAPTASAVPESAEPMMAAPRIDLRGGIDEATAFAAGRGLTVSIAVIDRERGEEVVNGPAADTPIFGASLVKVFLADNLLRRQRAGEFQLSAQDLGLLEAMMVESDDEAATSLYDRFGGTDMVTEVAQRYELPSVTPTTQPGEWELTTVSARDVVRYYDRLLDTTPAADRDYLVDLLRRSTEIADDGFNQFFGLPTALPDKTLAIKQGWMCCPREASYLHTTGLIGENNRFSVAILSQRPGVEADGFAIEVLDQIAILMFPPGTFGG